MGSIHVLQPRVAARVRSGYVIQTVAQAVEECFCNSIDAGATEVQIVIDERLFSFEIEDNGHGIPADSFGSLGVRFATSKLRNLDQLLAGPSTYGFRGEALASLAECSILQISSKARGQFQTWTKVISGGATLQVGLSTNQRKIHGTVVSVKDFQYNQPVRRKQSQLSRGKKDLKQCILNILKFAAVNTNVGVTLIQRGRREPLLHIPKDRQVDMLFPILFGDRSKEMQWVRHQEQDIAVRLFISSPAAGAGTRADQHMYINRRPVRGDQISKQLTLLHRQVKSFLDKGISRSPRAKTANANAFPAYICFVEAPQQPHDVTFEPDKSQIEFADWGPLLACVHRAAVKAWHAYVPSALLQDCPGPQLAETAAVSRDSSRSLSGRCAAGDELQGCQGEDAFQLDELSSPQDTALAGLLSGLNSPVYQPDARFGLQGEEQEMSEGRPPNLQSGSGYLSETACEEGNMATDGPSGKGSDWDAWQGLDTAGLGQASTFYAAYQRAGECQHPLQGSDHLPASRSQQERDRPALVVPSHTNWGRARQQQFKGVQHTSSHGPHLGWRKPRGCGLGSSDLFVAPQRPPLPARQGAWPDLRRGPQTACHGLRSIFGNLEEDLAFAVNGACNAAGNPSRGDLLGQGCTSQRGDGQEHLREVEEPHPIALQVQFASRPVSLQGGPSRAALSAVNCADNEGRSLWLSPCSHAALRQSPPDSSMPEARQTYVRIPEPSDEDDEGTSPLPCMRSFSPNGRLDPSSSPSDFVLAPSPVAAQKLQRAHSVDTPERLNFAGDIPFTTPLDPVLGFNFLAEPESLSPVPCIEFASPGSPIPRLKSVSTPESAFPVSCVPGASPLSSVSPLQLLDTQGSRPARSCKASTSPFSASPLQSLDFVDGVEEDTPHHSRPDQVLGAQPQSLSPLLEFLQSPKGHAPRPVAGLASCHDLEESAMPAVEPVAGCSRTRKRASSAPPQARKKVKTAHTNPISSLKCSGPSPPPVHGRPGIDGGATDRAEGQRGRLTVQGVHGALARQIFRTAEQSLGRSGRDGVASGDLRQRSLHDMGMRQRKRRQSDCNESRSHQPAKRPQEQVPDITPAPHATEQPSAAKSNPVLDSGGAKNVAGPTPLSASVRRKGKKPSQLHLPALLHMPQRVGSHPAQADEGKEFPNTECSSASGLRSPAPLQGLDVLTKGTDAAPGARRQDGNAEQADAHPGGVTLRDSQGNGEDPADKAAPEQRAVGKGRAKTNADASVDAMFQGWTNPCVGPPAPALPDLTALCDGAARLAAPPPLSRDALQSAWSLPQVDRKFIPIVCDGILAMVDQHAAHERVRLEELREQLFPHGDNRPDVQAFKLGQPVTLQQSAQDFQTLDAYKDAVEAWGWRWTVGMGEISITHAPCVLGRSLSLTDLQAFLHQLEETNGAARIPEGAVRVLNSRACRSALMFGDPITPVQGAAVVEALKATRLSFICAHGRPTLAPLADLSVVRMLMKLRGACSGAPQLPQDMGLHATKTRLQAHLDGC